MRVADDTSTLVQSDEKKFVGIDPFRCFIPQWLACSGGSYPQLYAKELNTSQHAHRLVARLLFGTLKSTDRVLHRCGDRQCHNPYHLYVAGDMENKRDRDLHHAARAQAEISGNRCAPRHYGRIFMPVPIAMSGEASRYPEFVGFEREKCFHADWLVGTDDGFRQLQKTDWSGQVVGAHRKIFQLFVGPIDKLDIIEHTCGDRSCLNPFHLLYAGRYRCRVLFDFRHDRRCSVPPEARWKAVCTLEPIAEIARHYNVHPNTLREFRRIYAKRALRRPME